MESKNVIYGLYCVCDRCNASEMRIRYVGQTRVGMKSRMVGHRKPSQTSRSTPVDNWKVKHGVENVRYEILEELDSPEELDSRERYWVGKMGTYVGLKRGGLNATEGGQWVFVNPDEVIEKIREANSKDSVPWAKVNREKARKMREAYQEGVPTRKLSREYGISQGHVWSILNNDVWKDPNYVFKLVKEDPRPLDERRSYVLTRKQAEEIRVRYQEGQETTQEIADDYKVSVVTISSVLNNHVYYDPGYTPGRAMTERQKQAISRSQKGVKKPKGHGEKVSSAIRGGGHGMSKLTEEKVIQIRKQRKEGRSSKELAEMFGVNPSQINRICSGARWGHVKEGL